ncbi:MULTISPECIES: hypothetical protein [unclassified Fictibacillus]|nr:MULTISPECIES: hypothetical protein [unclassified Fictibacillus]
MNHRLNRIILLMTVMFLFSVYLWSYAPSESAPIYLLTEEK